MYIESRCLKAELTNDGGYSHYIFYIGRLLILLVLLVYEEIL